MIDKGSLKDTMLKIVQVPGISGTESENLTCNKIYEILSDIPYFKKHPDNLKKVEIEGDILKRFFISALVEGKKNTKKTVILTGHFDVVGVEEYGHLKDIAFNPIEYTKRIGELKLDDDSRRDLESGDWIFGRGTADMKFGIALCIELLREYSEKKDFDGNILFIAVPGEESNSEGMIGAIKHLRRLQNEQHMEFIALLLAECYMPQEGDTDKIRYIHYGACGKVMPMFFFAGKETHVSAPFEGINPNLLASEVNRLIELNPIFCETEMNVTTAPPMCLKLNDLKDLYSVQTPIYATSYYNLITLKLEPQLLISKLKEICFKAFTNCIDIISERRAEYENICKNKVKYLEITPCVMTYEELYKNVKQIHGEKFEIFINEQIQKWREQGLENQKIAVNIIKQTYEKYPNKTPMILIAFTPPFYPDRYPEGKNAEKLFEVIDSIIEYAKEKHNEVFMKADYFMGISDLSYTGLEQNYEVEKILSNMPGFNKNYILPFEHLKDIDIPAIVIGGYGKDFHKYTERLNLSFSFNVIPDVYEYAIDRLLNN